MTMALRLGNRRCTEKLLVGHVIDPDGSRLSRVIHGNGDPEGSKEDGGSI